MIPTYKSVLINKVRQDFKETLKDKIPVELFLLIYLNKIPVTIISCFPKNLLELVIGYLINNSYIEKYSDIKLIRLCDNEKAQNKLLEIPVYVEADQTVDNKKSINQDFLAQKFIPKHISSSCESFNEQAFCKEYKIKKITTKSKIEPKMILKLNSETIKNQRFKKLFGGLHCASLFDSHCKLLCSMEDIGRHNCIDKIAGYIQAHKIKPTDKIIFTTGRISTDLILKIHKMSIPIIVSNSSITHGAVSLAKRAGITAIGYARGGRFNIYSCPSRIIS